MEGKPTKDEETSEVESTPNTHRELAIEATELFERGEFSESLSRLAKLQEQRPLDTRFTHNAAVVKFYANNFKNVDDFKRKLDSVCSLVSATISYNEYAYELVLKLFSLLGRN